MTEQEITFFTIGLVALAGGLLMTPIFMGFAVARPLLLVAAGFWATVFAVSAVSAAIHWDGLQPKDMPGIMGGLIPFSAICLGITGYKAFRARNRELA
ncbi:hypothetical protein C4552_02330 [Candidatus Parcubacteria bacterium]|nr:MAG: hypothetical protein C4552_02330 [Candidatus Parcubacteria bacterium]